MSLENKYQSYTASDILRYLQGGMNAQEMRQLELVALDDPFLQDAIDGYRLGLEKEGKEKLLMYANEAAAKPAVSSKEPARVIPFFRMGILKYAVAALLVAGTGWYLFNLKNPSLNSKEIPAPATAKIDTDAAVQADIVAEKVEEQPAEKPVIKQTAPTVAKLQNPAPEEDARLAKQEMVQPPAMNGVTTSEKDIAARPKKLSPASTTAPLSDNYSSDTGFVKGIESNRKTDMAFIQNEKARDLSRSPAKSGFQSFSKAGNNIANPRYSISGQTVDKEKYPLENITLRVKGDTIATVSDELGRFTMDLPDSQAVVVLSGIGIETKEILAKSKSGKMEVELEQSKSNMLEEVVISDYAAKKKKAVATLDIDTTDAAPAGGWKNFTRYVEKNQQIKSDKKNVYVVISFEIDENGRPASMDILQSGGKTYDKEAMRLLKAGPNWINKTQNKVSFAKITIVL